MQKETKRKISNQLQNEHIKYNINYLPLSFGLSNCGNSCYFNSLLQALISCTSFNETLLNLKNNKKNELIINLQNFIRSFLRGNKNQSQNDWHNVIHKVNHNKIAKSDSSYIILRSMISLLQKRKETSKFSLGRQQCAHEGLEMLFYVINPQIKYDHFDFPEIDNLFRHRYHKYKKCKESLNNSNYISSEENCIFLIDPDDLNNMSSLNDYLTNHIYFTDEDHNCSNCDKKGRHKVIMTLKMIPEILIILFKKYMKKPNLSIPKTLIFQGNKENKENKKNKENKEDKKNKGNKENKGNEKKIYNYEVVSQIEHYGNMRGGHYICIAKRKNGWKKLNDSRVVEGEFSPSPNTYMVFYHIT